MQSAKTPNPKPSTQSLVQAIADRRLHRIVIWRHAGPVVLHVRHRVLQFVPCVH